MNPGHPSLAHLGLLPWSPGKPLYIYTVLVPRPGLPLCTTVGGSIQIVFHEHTLPLALESCNMAALPCSSFGFVGLSRKHVLPGDLTLTLHGHPSMPHSFLSKGHPPAPGQIHLPLSLFFWFTNQFDITGNICAFPVKIALNRNWRKC